VAPRVAQMPSPEFRKRTAIRLNACLLVQNVIVSAAVIYAGVLAIEQFDRAEETFLLNARLVKDPLPCAIPTPDIYYLFQGLGLADTSILHSVSRDTWMDRVEYALCHASYSQSSVGSTDAAYDYAKRGMTLAFLMKNHELRPPKSFEAYVGAQNDAAGLFCYRKSDTEPSTPSTYAQAEEDPPVYLYGGPDGCQVTGDHLWARELETNTVDLLCNISHADHGDSLNGEFNSKLYGDMVERVSRAYLNAMPAFYKLATSGKHPAVLVNAAPYNWERSCMEDKHPFGEGLVSTAQCPWVDTIRRELAAAGTTAQSALMVGHHTSKTPAANAEVAGVAKADNPEIDQNDHYKESMPRVDAMLYRLLALTVVAHHDRLNNQGRCFVASEAGTMSAGKLCQDIYGAAGKTDPADTNVPPAVLIPGFESFRPPTLSGLTNYDMNGLKMSFNSYQHRMSVMIPAKHRTTPASGGASSFYSYEYAADGALNPMVYGGDARPQARTCHMGERDYFDFSPPPPAPQWDFQYAAAPSPPPNVDPIPLMDAVVDACTRNMQWGLLEQTRLFGLPDAVQPFVAEPRDPTGHAFQWMYETFQNDYFTNVVKNKQEEDNMKFTLRAWSGFQMALTGLWTSMFAAVLGYFAAFSFLPLIVAIWYRLPCCYLTDSSGIQRMIVRPPLRSDKIFYLVTLFGLFVWFWLVFVSPTAGPHYPVSDDCAEFHKGDDGVHGGVYVTSGLYETGSFLVAKSAPGWTLLFVIGFVWFYEFFLTYFQEWFNQVYATVKKIEESTPEMGRYNAASTGIAILLVAICIGVSVATAVIQGNYWVEGADVDADLNEGEATTFTSENAEAVWLGHEVRMVPITAFLQSFGVGVLAQRYVYQRLSDDKLLGFYLGAALAFVAPYWVRISLMTDQWDELFTKSKRQDQAFLFYLGLGSGASASVLCIIGLVFMCNRNQKAKPKTQDANAAAAAMTDPNATVKAQAAAEKAAAQTQKDQVTADAAKAVDDQQKQVERKVSRWQRALAFRDRVAADARNANRMLRGRDVSGSSASAGGAYLPMIRITV